MSFAQKPHSQTSGRYGYLTLPGAAGAYASTPDSTAVSVTGDIDIRVKCALTDWTPVTTSTLIAKYLTTGNQRSYQMSVASTGVLTCIISIDGAAYSQATSSVVTGITDGVAKWIRVTRASATGVAKFYTSDDGSSWAQLGTDRSTTAGSLFDSTQLLEVGSLYSGTVQPVAGKIYYAQVRDNILDDGSGIVFAADFTDTGRSFIESANGATVTIHGTTAIASVHP